jgi:hypothetical protein
MNKEKIIETFEKSQLQFIKTNLDFHALLQMRNPM